MINVDVAVVFFGEALNLGEMAFRFGDVMLGFGYVSINFGYETIAFGFMSSSLSKVVIYLGLDTLKRVRIGRCVNADCYSDYPEFKNGFYNAFPSLMVV